MRLLNTKPSDTGNFIIEEFFGEPPPYAVLSHTWHEMEVTFQDVTSGVMDKKGFKKVHDCCTFAGANGYGYAWIDTCCIDKTSSAELSESLNSMYRWYQEADVCYAYLADVPEKPMSESRWFERGWTLQELIAPSMVLFLDHNWKELGTKESLCDTLSEITSIPVSILAGVDDVEAASVAQRMSWAARRETTRVEDRAYCLMGIFGINMPPIYGEGKNAFIRLQEEIMKALDDHSIFAWRSDSEEEKHGGLLATSPDAFRESANVIPFNPFTTVDGPLTVSSKGIHLDLHLIGIGHPGLGLGILHCTEKEASNQNRLITIYLQDPLLTMQKFQRIHSGRFELLSLGDLKPTQYPLRRLCVQQRRPANRKTIKRGKVKDTGAAMEDLHTQLLVNPLQASRDREINWINANGISGNGQTLLSHAAGKGHIDILWLLLTRSDVRAGGRDLSGRTPLSRAADCGQEAVVKLLLSRNDVDPDYGDKDGRTPLSYAAASGHLAIVKLLFQSGKVYADSNNELERTPVSWAAGNGHEQVVKHLLEKGAEVDSKDERGRTPLSWAAARNNHGSVVALLLENGAAIDCEDGAGRTPLAWAAREGRVAVVPLLIEKGADIESKNNESITPLLWAALKNQDATARLLIQKGASIEHQGYNSRTPLACAAEHGHETVVKVLLEMGANLYPPNLTPLLLAAERGRAAVVRLLLDKGADIQSRDKSGLTSLALAASRSHETTVKLLLEQGADIESQDHWHRTPLSYAAQCGNEAIVKLFIERGADIAHEDDWRKTPLMYAEKNGHGAIMKLFQDPSY